MDRMLTSGEIIDFMESRSIGPISGSAELFLLCQIAYELKLVREERESVKDAKLEFEEALAVSRGLPLPARHPEAIVDKGKRRK